MRSYNAFIRTKLSQDVVSCFNLVDLELETMTLHFTDTQTSLKVIGETITYIPDVGILNFNSPKQTSVVDREAFSFSIADVTGALKGDISRSIAGKPVRFRLGFFNDDGTPNLDPANIITSYAGYIDTVAYENDGEVASLSFEGSSPMHDLSLVKTMITSKQGMDQVSLTDTSFDNIIDQNEVIYKWGKA